MCLAADSASLGADNALLTLAIPQTTARKAIHHAISLLNLHEMELQRAQVCRPPVFSSEADSM